MDWNTSALNEEMRKLEDYYDRLPECDWCGEKIVDDYCYNILGEMVCRDCVEACKEFI